MRMRMGMGMGMGMGTRMGMVAGRRGVWSSDRKESFTTVSLLHRQRRVSPSPRACGFVREHRQNL